MNLLCNLLCTTLCKILYKENEEINQGNLYTGGRGLYRMYSCQSTVELAAASVKNIFHDSKSAKPIVG